MIERFPPSRLKEATKGRVILAKQKLTEKIQETRMKHQKKSDSQIKQVFYVNRDKKLKITNIHNINKD